MRLRSSSRCSIRLMPGSSTRSVTAFRALLTASDGSTIVCRRFYCLVCILNGGVLRVGCDLWSAFIWTALLLGGLFLHGFFLRQLLHCGRFCRWPIGRHRLAC